MICYVSIQWLHTLKWVSILQPSLDYCNLLQKEHKKYSRIKDLCMHSDKTALQMHTHISIIPMVNGNTKAYQLLFFFKFLHIVIISSVKSWNPLTVTSLLSLLLLFVRKTFSMTSCASEYKFPPLKPLWCWQRCWYKMTKCYSPMDCDNSSQSEWNRHIWYLRLHLWRKSKEEIGTKGKHFKELYFNITIGYLLLLVIYITPLRKDLQTILLIKVHLPAFTWPFHRTLPWQKDNMIGIPNCSLD